MPVITNAEKAIAHQQWLFLYQQLYNGPTGQERADPHPRFYIPDSFLNTGLTIKLLLELLAQQGSKPAQLLRLPLGGALPIGGGKLLMLLNGLPDVGNTRAG